MRAHADAGYGIELAERNTFQGGLDRTDLDPMRRRGNRRVDHLDAAAGQATSRASTLRSFCPRALASGPFGARFSVQAGTTRRPFASFRTPNHQARALDIDP